MDYFSILFTSTGVFYLVILSLLEIVLGIDNIIFISIVTDKLPKEKKRIARKDAKSLFATAGSPAYSRNLPADRRASFPHFFILRTALDIRY
jgi:hypothetical protein